MKIDFIPLANVPTVESLTDSAKVLVIDSGEVKKTAVSNVGGGGGLASEVFPFAAHVSYVETGLPTLNAAMFTDSFETGLVFAIKDETNETYDEMEDWILVNGEYDVAILGTTNAVDTGTDIDGVYLEYNPAVWSVTVLGNAEVLTAEGGAAVFVKGDCTINAEFIGT